MPTQTFLDFQYDVYWDTQLSESIYFNGGFDRRTVNNVTQDEVRALHEYMQTLEFQEKSYSDQLSEVFTKAFEMKDAMEYQNLETPRDRAEAISPALQLAAFGITSKGYLNFYEQAPRRLSRDGESLPENEAADYASGDIYEIIPSRKDGSCAYDKKYHTMLALGITVGRGETSPFTRNLDKTLYMAGELATSASGFARSIIDEGRVRYRYDLGDVKADFAGQQLGLDLLEGKVNMSDFDIGDYMNCNVP